MDPTEEEVAEKAVPLSTNVGEVFKVESEAEFYVSSSVLVTEIVDYDLVRQEFLSAVRYFQGWPKPGINFVDIMPIFHMPYLLDRIAEVMAAAVRVVTGSSADKPVAIVGLEARGFLIGPLVALKLKAPFVCVRKKGKLPGPTFCATYEKEYGKDEFEIQRDAFQPGTKVAIVDDLLATGGTMAAAAKLVSLAEGSVAGFFALVELKSLNGRKLVVESVPTAPCWTLVASD